MPDLGQRRAAYAWEKVQDCGEKYANIAKGAPALIMGNGLMQTLAFYQGKEEHHRLLNQHICEWLIGRFREQGQIPTSMKSAGSKQEELFSQVIRALAGAEPPLYRQATEEAMALLRWIRQFASAVTG
jgi:CRISPR-associated protein Cmr5